MGPDLALRRLLEEEPHSLIKQAWAPQEMEEAVLNADGFGVGWYDQDHKAAVYTNTLPIWSDTNLPGLGRSLQSSVWLANIRSATPGQALSQVNTQPFVHDNFMFIHNGYLAGFHPTVKQALHDYLLPEIQAHIRGDTDSEYLFALFRQALAEANGDAVQGLEEALKRLATLLNGAAALLNIIIYAGQKLVVCRHGLNNGNCPSLYYTTTHPNFPDASLIASERFSMPEVWQEVDKHSLLIFSKDEPPVSQHL